MTYLELVYTLGQLCKQANRVLKRELNRLSLDHLSTTQVLLLVALGEKQLSVTALANHGTVLHTNIAYNVRRLLDYGLIEQTYSASDRRLTYVSATPAGRKLCRQLMDQCSHGDEISFNDLALLSHAIQRVERVVLGKAADRAVPRPAELA